MEKLIELIPSIGFYGVCLAAMGIFFKYLITKILENNDSLMEQNIKREERMVNLIENNTKAITEITCQLDKSNDVSKELVTTNKSLVEEINIKLNNIDNNINKILDK